MTILKKSMPLVATTFINRLGGVGLNLIPMLLVEKHLSVAESTVVISMIKFTSVAGTFLGGYFSDVLGMKRSLLLSFFCTGLGLLFLPWHDNLFYLTFFASLAQTGNNMFGGPMRMLMTDSVGPKEQKEAWGYYRTAHHGGSVVAHGLASVFSFIGIPGLMLFDAFTSFLAVGLGQKMVQEKGELARLHEQIRPSHDPATRKNYWSIFWSLSLINFGFLILIELWLVGLAAICKIYFGKQGVYYFSLVMFLNALLSTIFCLKAARGIRSPGLSMFSGILCVAMGCCLTFIAPMLFPLETTLPTQLFWPKCLIFFGVFLLTTGDILYTALSTFLTIRFTPPVKKTGLLYSVALSFNPLGRIVGAALAFPLAVYGTWGPQLSLGIGAILLIMILKILPRLRNEFAKQEKFWG